LLVLSDYICNPLKSLFHLNKYFLKYKWHLILGFIFIVFSNYFGVYMPKIIDQAADELLKHVSNKNENSNNLILWDLGIRLVLMYMLFAILK